MLNNLLYVVWNIDPVMFSIGDRGIRWYGLLLALGFLLGYLIISKVMTKEGTKQEVVDKFAIYIILGTVIGLRLGHCLFYNPYYYLTNPIKILYVWEGGLASHGGAMGILFAIWLFARKYKQKYLYLLDRVVLVIPLAGAMVRIGNLMNSEIVGNPTNVPWAFKFLRNSEDYEPAINAAKETCNNLDLQCLVQFWTPRHPSQLYEAVFYFIMFAVFFIVFKKFINKWENGTFLAWFVTVLFTFRYIVEFTKQDPVEFEGWTSAISMGQLLSIPFIAFGIILLINRYKTKKNRKINQL